MKIISKYLKAFTVLFVGIGMLGCDEDDVMLPEVKAEFTYTVNQENGVVRFINTSENANVYNWDFGDEETSSEVNPTHIYQPGTYTVVLSARNVASPFVTFSDTITIQGSDPDPDPDPDCTAEMSENVDPANGDLNWTFMTNDATTMFEAFGNIAGEIVDNPVLDDVNSSCNVQKVTKTAGCETWSGLGIELQTALDFTNPATNKVFTMKVLAETQASEVTLRLERLPFPDVDPSHDRVATITQMGAWEELTFDFSDVTSGTYKSMIIYFERDAPCDGDIYYFDDIAQVEGTGGGGGGGTFDDGLLVNGDFEAGADPWFGNALDVQTDGGNSFNFANVMAAGNPFDVNLSQVVEIEQGKTYTLSFDASSDGNRTLVAGIGLNEAPWTNDSQTVNLTTETQTFTLTLSSADFGIPNSRVLFDMGADTGVVVIDNVSLFCDDCDGGGGGTGTGGGCDGDPVAATAFPVDFESCESFISTFNDVGSITTSLTDNPSVGGINTSDYVLRVDKAAGTNKWAGFQNAFPSNFDATGTFKFKIYSTKANVVMRFEVNSDPQPPSSGNPGPQFVTIADANTWTEVEINFTGIPPSNTGLNQLVIKPDNEAGSDGGTTTTDETYYFDDIRLE